MTLSINGLIFNDIFSFHCDDCELSIIFNQDHEYSTIEEIENKLAGIGISIGNFYFKGVNKWTYYLPTDEVNPELHNLLKEDGETSILCVIPENIRDNFQINCTL